MNEISRKIMNEYQVRKSRKQKERFRAFLIPEIEKMGYSVKAEKGGLLKSVNLVIGDVDQAEVLCTAHYDTCARMPIPNFITPMNIPVYLLYQGLIVILLFTAAFLMTAVSWFFISDPFWRGQMFSISSLILCWLMIFGPANPNTANDNTSGVIMITELLSLLKETDRKVAFVLFDHEEAGLLGASQFVKKHPQAKKKALVLNFDCVSDGDTFLFALSKPLHQESDLIEKLNLSYIKEENKSSLIEKKAFYPSDQKVFYRGIGIAALKKNRWFGYYMDRIHTAKDTVMNESNLDYLSHKTVNFIENYLKESK